MCGRCVLYATLTLAYEMSRNQTSQRCVLYGRLGLACTRRRRAGSRLLWLAVAARASAASSRSPSCVVSLLAGPGVQSGGLRLAVMVLPVLEQLVFFGVDAFFFFVIIEHQSVAVLFELLERPFGVELFL